MKKILFVHYNIFEKRRWGRTFPLAKGAKQCGLDVTLLTISQTKGIGSKTVVINGVKVLQHKDIIPTIFINKGFGLFSILFRIFHVLTNKYDYVYIDCGEGINTGWIGKIAQWRGSILISEWGDLLGKGGYYDNKPLFFKILYGWYYLWAEHYFRKSADYTAVLSSMMKNHALNIGIPEEKIRIVPGGAITDIIQPSFKPKSILGIDNNIITLGYIGIDEGELKDLLPLLTVLKKEPYKNKFKIVTFGSKLSQEILNKYGISDIIINYGWLNFYEDYSAAQCVDIYVLMKTTNIERSSMGWPNKLGDYMALGRPVLLNTYGDITDFVTKYPDGFIKITLNENEIAQQLDNIINNKYCLTEMGKSNRKIAEEVISWKARMSNLIQSINDETIKN